MTNDRKYIVDQRSYDGGQPGKLNGQLILFLQTKTTTAFVKYYCGIFFLIYLFRNVNMEFPVSLYKLARVPEGYLDSLDNVIKIIEDFRKPHYNKSPKLRGVLINKIYQLTKSEIVKIMLSPLIDSNIHTDWDITEHEISSGKQLINVFINNQIFPIVSQANYSSVESVIQYYDNLFDSSVGRDNPFALLNNTRIFNTFVKRSEEDIIQIVTAHPLLFTYFQRQYDNTEMYAEKIIKVAKGLVNKPTFRDRLTEAYLELSFTDFPLILEFKKMLLTVMSEVELDKKIFS